jgi:hypothetical protein
MRWYLPVEATPNTFKINCRVERRLEVARAAAVDLEVGHIYAISFHLTY